MILKRFLTAALGALGLGALAAGTALAQSPQPPGNGNIPAPDLFDGQIACSTRVPAAMTLPMPSAVAMGAMGSPLDVLLRGGTTAMVGTTPVAIDITGTGMGSYADLIYFVPATGNNCGSGEAFADDGSVAADVARGYSAVRTQYDQVVAQEATVAAAQTAYDNALKAASATNPNTAAINAALKVLTDAQTELAKRNTALQNLMSGTGSLSPIYRAGITEWRSQAAVVKAVTDWNTAVADVNTKQTTLDNSTFGTTDTDNNVVTGYVALGTDPSGTDAGSVGNVLNADGTINLTNLRNYADVEGDGSREGDNFADDGSLLVPMRNTLDPDDGDAQEETPTQDTIGNIRADRDAAVNAYNALLDAQAKNTNTGLNDTYTEALRRAKLERDHLNDEWNKAIVDTATDFRTDEQKRVPTADNPNTNYEASPITIASRNAELQESIGKRNTVESTLRTNVSTRETNTADLVEKFTSPAPFYQQLVDRRQALLNAAQSVVNKITTAGGTPTTAQKNAVDNAQKALTAASNDQKAYQAIADNPANKALIDVLLKTDGDDGKALVDAISSTHGGIGDNTDRLDALLTSDAEGNETGRIADIESSISGLTGDSGKVGENSAAIETNTTAIAANADDIEQIQLDVYGTTDLAHDDEAACGATGLLNTANCNKAAIAHNAGDIADNAGDIADNADAIDDLGGRVDDNEDAIAANKMAIDDEAAARMAADDALGARIDTESDERKAADTALGARIDTESDERKAADMMLATAIDDEMGAREAADMILATAIDDETAARMAADADEMAAREAADTAIRGEFAAADSSLRSDLTGMINSNTGMINDNRRMIGELSDDLDVVRAGVAASMALAGMPAINGRGIAIGVGSYDGESAFAVGFQIQGEQASFKIGVTSSGGETGASAGVGFNF